MMRNGNKHTKQTAGRWILAMVAGALVFRLALSFMGEGPDLAHFMRIGERWYNGISPYDPSLPYRYPPLYLYFAWLAKALSGGHHLLFVFFAKLPQVVLDVFTGWIIMRIIHKLSRNERSAMFAGALYLFNPLVLYNVAFYGRFDQLCTFFSVAGYAVYASVFGSSLLFSLVFCTKCYTLLFLPYLLFKDWKRMFVCGALFAGALALLSLPFLINNPKPVSVFRMMFAHADYWPLGLSWQTALSRFFSMPAMIEMSKYLLLAELFMLIVFPKRDFLSFATFSLTTFPFFSKIVFEQYLTWAIPFLLMDYYINHKRHALYMVIIFTVTGLLFNGHSFDGSHYFVARALGLPQNAFNIPFASCMIAYGVVEYMWIRRQKTDQP